MTEPSTPTINYKAVRHHARAALAALEADFNGERLPEVQMHIRTLVALLHDPTT